MVRILVLFVSLFLLIACGTSPEQVIYEHMEKAVSLEENFANQQQPLVDAEKKEHTLFEEIISLSLSEKEGIEKLTEEALAVVELRKSLLEIENKSIEAGYEQFQQVASELTKLKNNEAKMLAEKVVETMERRFNSYKLLAEKYEHSLTLDEQLYKMFQIDTVTIEELQKQIDKINEAYIEVKELKEVFNEQTREFNELKKQFYQSTKLNVTFEQ